MLYHDLDLMHLSLSLEEFDTFAASQSLIYLERWTLARIARFVIWNARLGKRENLALSLSLFSCKTSSTKNDIFRSFRVLTFFDLLFLVFSLLISNFRIPFEVLPNFGLMRISSWGWSGQKIFLERPRGLQFCFPHFLSSSPALTSRRGTCAHLVDELLTNTVQGPLKLRL